MFVNKARFMPQVSVCVNARPLAVLNCAKLLKKPASSSGQHQLPTSAGTEQRSVQLATNLVASK